MLTQILGLELASQGVRCFSVSPGTTATPLLNEQLKSYSKDNIVAGVPQHFRTGIPSGRLVQPSEVAAAILALTGPGISSFQLNDLVIDGGQSLGM